MELLVPSSRDVATHLDAGYALALTNQGSTIEVQRRKVSCATVDACMVR
jgi:hypothetical protein